MPLYKVHTPINCNNSIDRALQSITKAIDNKRINLKDKTELVSIVRSTSLNKISMSKIAEELNISRHTVKNLLVF